MIVRLPAAALFASVALAICASPAHAVDLGQTLSPAILGIDFPSVRSIVEDVVRFFFSTLLDALVPDWMKDASVEVLKRLVRVPNPTDASTWPTLRTLSEAMKWIAIPLLSLAAVASWAQHWMRELTGHPASFEQPVLRTALAAVLLVVYPVFMSNGIALVNTVTNAMLSVPVAADGLERTVGVVFAGSLVAGSTVLLAVLGIGAVMLMTGLFMLSVGLVVITGLLYVSAPLAIVCSVVDETRGIWQAWRYALLTTVAVPIGWCVLFTSAGAFVVDMTNWSGGIGGQLGERFVGVIAAIVIVYLAVRWPLMLWGAISAQLAGALLTVGGRRVAVSGAGSANLAGGRAARTALQRSAVQLAGRTAAPIGAVRRSIAGSARLAAGAGVAATGHVPGVAHAARAAAHALQPIAAGAKASRPAGTVRDAAHGAIVRGRAAEHAATRRLAAGGTAAETINAAVRAGSRPTSSASERDRPRAPSEPSRPKRGSRATRTSTTSHGASHTTRGRRVRPTSSASSESEWRTPGAVPSSRVDRAQPTPSSSPGRGGSGTRSGGPSQRTPRPSSRDVSAASGSLPQPPASTPPAPPPRPVSPATPTTSPGRPSASPPAADRAPSGPPQRPAAPRPRPSPPTRPPRRTQRGA